MKTPEQVALFGGTAGQIMHPCYHTVCDRLDTVNVPFLDELSDAGAHAILWFAQERSEARGVQGAAQTPPLARSTASAG